MAIMDFSSWMALREQAPAQSLPGQTAAARKPKGPSPVDKMVQDVVSDKAVAPSQIKPKVKKIADNMRAAAAMAAKSGDVVQAIDQATRASEISQIANRK